MIVSLGDLFPLLPNFAPPPTLRISVTHFASPGLPLDASGHRPTNRPPDQISEGVKTSHNPLFAYSNGVDGEGNLPLCAFLSVLIPSPFLVAAFPAFLFISVVVVLITCVT